MGNKIIVPFSDKDGGNYELNVDLDRLSKGEMLNAIKGMGRTIKKNQRSILADDDLGNLPEIFDAIDHSNKKSWWPIFAGDKKTQKPKSVPSPQDHRKKSISCGERHELYNTKSLNRQSSNPFIPALNKVKPSEIENEVLSWFKDEVVKAKNIDELEEIIDEALSAGIRINAYCEGQRSFADTVILKMLLIPCTKNEKKDMIRELLLKGAFFSYDLLQDKQISEVYNKLYREVQPQIDKRLKKLEEIGKNAVQGGSVEDVGIDNQTFFIKFSEGSTVEPAKVLEGTRNFGLNKGLVELGGHIIKIGDNEVEVKIEEGGGRNYTSLSDGSDLTMTLHSDLGEVKIRLCHDRENYDRVQVKVADKEMWAELQERGEEVGKNCLFAGMTVKEAVEKGSFMR